MRRLMTAAIVVASLGFAGCARTVVVGPPPGPAVVAVAPAPAPVVVVAPPPPRRVVAVRAAAPVCTFRTRRIVRDDGVVVVRRVRVCR